MSKPKQTIKMQFLHLLHATKYSVFKQVSVFWKAINNKTTWLPSPAEVKCSSFCIGLIGPNDDFRTVAGFSFH